jgi:hypothetical protein
VNYLILILMGLIFLGQKVRTNWIAGIKSSLLKIMQPGADRRLFSGFTQSPIGWVRNAASWVRSFNWTGTAAGIMGLGGVGGGTLITSRHVLFANHVPYRTLPQPFDIFFVNADSRTFTYKVTSIQQVGTTDIAIGTLDRAVDSSINIYSVLPYNWTDYVKVKKEAYNTMGVKGVKLTLSLPVLYGNQTKMIATGDVVEIDFGKAIVRSPEFEPARAWASQLAVGDSGNPIFVMVGDELVLLGAWHTGSNGMDVGTFPWLIDYRPEIEAIIGMKLRVADLSGLDRIA